MNRKKYHVYLDIIATSIIAIAVISTLCVGYNYLKFPSPKTESINIEYSISKDSLIIKDENQIKKLDSILGKLQNISNKIQKNQAKLIEQKTDDSFYNKFYTAVVAIILALAGFFGFKSVSEIKTQAIDDAKKESTAVAEKKAKKEARKVAKDEFNTTFNAEYKKAIFDEANDAMINYLREQIGSLEDRVANLERNVPNNNDDDDDNNVELANPDPIDPIIPPTSNTIGEDTQIETKDDQIEQPKNPFDNE